MIASLINFRIREYEKKKILFVDIITHILEVLSKPINKHCMQISGTILRNDFFLGVFWEQSES